MSRRDVASARHGRAPDAKGELGIRHQDTLAVSDDAALAGAMKSARGKTKTAVINEALREYARRRRIRRLPPGRVTGGRP
jgi:hypothetical protein